MGCRGKASPTVWKQSPPEAEAKYKSTVQVLMLIMAFQGGAINVATKVGVSAYTGGDTVPPVPSLEPPMVMPILSLTRQAR